MSGRFYNHASDAIRAAINAADFINSRVARRDQPFPVYASMRSVAVIYWFRFVHARRRTEQTRSHVQCTNCRSKSSTQAGGCPQIYQRLKRS